MTFSESMTTFLSTQAAQQIFYTKISGETSAPLLVFLHEGLGCTAMWKNFPDRLCQATGCPGLIYDRHGYGQSAPRSEPFNSDYMHYAATAELPELLRIVAPDVPYILIGHSDGGTISLIHAARKPSNCLAVITEAAHVFVEEITLAGVRKAIEAWHSGKLRTLLKKFHGDNAEAVFRAWSGIWLEQDFRNWNIVELLPDISIPALIIQGEDDQYGSLRQVDTILAGIGEKAQSAIITACGHAPHHQKIADTLKLMADFILSLPDMSESSSRKFPHQAGREGAR